MNKKSNIEREYAQVSLTSGVETGFFMIVIALLWKYQLEQ